MIRSKGRLARRIAAYTGMTLASAWAEIALLIDLHPQALGIVVGVIYCLAVLGLLWRRSVAACLVCFLLVLGWWLTLRPSNAGPWQTDVSRPAWAEVNGTHILIHDFRSCDYRAEFDYTCQWFTKPVELNDIVGLDLFMDYWGSPWIAHTILSFALRDGDHIAFSIETRKRVGQEYSAWRGFFRQYTLISMVSDERDVVRLRTNYRKGEDLYLWHTTATPEFARSLFLNYVGLTNGLHDHPAWYNAITHNCTTEIYTFKAMKGQYWDWRILLNGKGDAMGYEHGMLATGGLPYPQWKQQALINPAAKAANNDPDFSARIRAGRAGF